MESEVREILRAALERPGPGMGTRIQQRFAATGDPDFELPDRRDQPRAVAFDE